MSDNMSDKTLFAVLLLGALMGIGTSRPVRAAGGAQEQTVHFRSFGVTWSQCDDVFPEPVVPTAVPSWAYPSVEELRADGSVEEIGSAGVFRKHHDIVIRTCTTSALEDVFKYIAPYPEQGRAYPNFDIYFACGTNTKYVIPVEKELQFGTPWDNTGGTFRMIAPRHNVELNGGFRTRIIKVFKFSHVTVTGIVFKNGRMVDMKKHHSEAYPGEWGGAAILANFHSTLVVHRCKFYDNISRSQYCRHASGGAVMAESASKVYIWGSYFRGNHAANGGAVAGSAPSVLYVAQSTFVRNVAQGGLDTSKTKVVNGVSKPVLQIRGGAMRVDSVTGHAKDDEHVFVCNTKFHMNKIRLTHKGLAFYGYAPDEAGFLYAGAAAFAMWNKSDALYLADGDRNVLTIRGCEFKGNYKQMPWEDYRAGNFVLDVRAAGDIDIRDTKFSDNIVQQAVAGLDNSDYFTDSLYKLTMRNIEFSGNGDIWTTRFPPHHSNMCDVENVVGMNDGTGECRSFQWVFAGFP